eukprot:3520608-Rhodomonas_salina.1
MAFAVQSVPTMRRLAFDFTVCTSSARMVLRLPYAVSGTDIGRAYRPMSSLWRVWYGASLWCYIFAPPCPVLS